MNNRSGPSDRIACLDMVCSFYLAPKPKVWVVPVVRYVMPDEASCAIGLVKVLLKSARDFEIVTSQRN